MPIIGGDESELAILKTTFERQAAILQELTATLRGQLANTNWQGPSAERFRSAWSSMTASSADWSKPFSTLGPRSDGRVARAHTGGRLITLTRFRPA